MKQFRKCAILLLGTILTLVITACGWIDANPTITLVENPWPASELNVAGGQNHH